MHTLLERLERVDAMPDAVSEAARMQVVRRLLYAVNHCYPFSSNGYAVRTHAVASALAQEGVDVVVASRPGVPWSSQAADTDVEHRIEGVRYVQRPLPSERGMAREDYLAAAVDAWTEVIRVFKPMAVMAASNWRNALPAAIAAREAGLPFWYEVRGFWEISRISHDPDWAQTDEYQLELQLEAQVALSAHRVFTLNRFMQAELQRRGVDPQRLALVPNGFSENTDLSAQTPSRSELGIQARYVVGYVGSFNAYEGLELLIEALALLRARGIDLALLLVGSGAVMGLAGDGVARCAMTQAYRRQAEELGVADMLFMPGRVSPALAQAYYRLLDIVVIPRRPLKVCELVSPLKPLEAAAAGKRVLVSDVAPLAELCDLSTNFSCFSKGDVHSLADRLADLLTQGDFSPPSCPALAALTWSKVIEPIRTAMNALPPPKTILPSTVK